MIYNKNVEYSKVVFIGKQFCTYLLKKRDQVLKSISQKNAEYIRIIQKEQNNENKESNKITREKQQLTDNQLKHKVVI